MFKKIVLGCMALLLVACDALGTPPAPRTEVSSDPVGTAYAVATNAAIGGTTTAIYAALTPTKAQPTLTATVQPTSTPMVNPTSTPMATAAGNCLDGEAIGNELNQLDRTPVGLGENNSALEVSWPGQGFGNFDRTSLVVPALDNKYQVFVVNVKTIHMTRYCGTLEQVELYLSGGAHIKSMQVTAVDTAGNMPNANEIGVYSLNLTTKTLKVLKAAPNGPSVEEVMTHLQIVDLATGQIYGGPTTNSSNSGTTITLVAPAAATCGPSVEIDLGPWVAKDRQVTGPSIVNVGFPGEGTTMYRTNVLAGVTATFLAAAGKAWKFDPGCSVVEIQRQLTANAGGITVVTLESLVAQGKARMP